jgi:cobalt-zinc-cadmium efflux system membrane fusion protein
MSSFIKPFGLFLLSLATLAIPSLQAQDEAADKAAPKKDLIILDEIGVKNLTLELTETQEADFEQTVFALGRIEVFPGNLTVVSSRIPGRAYSVLVKADMEVAQGDELLWVESRQPGDPPPTVKIEAPRDGIISKLNIAPGQPISAEDSLLEIIDLSQVHAVARVPEHFAGRLKQGQKAHIRVSGYPDKTFEATLAHLGATADAASGTLEAAFHVPNPDKLLRPGMKAEFSIVTNSRSGVTAVPRGAVQGEGASRFVYIADYELKHAFEKVPVEIGEQNETMVEIVNGLFPGDQVVTRGAYSLGFAGKGSVSLKEALDAAHGHPHGEDGSELTAEEAKAKGGGDHGHAHGSGGGFNTLTLFFAGLSALLFVLLLLSLAFRKTTTA